MPAAVVKGIIVSLSIITALSIAVLENPQVQAWLEQQRQKVAELLRSIGEDLDPESRRVAEAFAYEGKTPASDVGLRREVSGSKEAAAVATGRSMSGSSSTVRRIPVRGPNDPNEAEERRRKGRDYLAQRNQQMYELQQRRKAAKAEGAATPPSPTSFDAMVDREGKLKSPAVEGQEVLPSPPAIEPVPEKMREEMREVGRQLVQPLLAGSSSSSSGMNGLQLGSRFADPFGDEFEMERSQTPKPPVPPKVALDREEPEPIRHIPGGYSPLPAEPQQEQGQQDREELTYEEQLAIALSLSEADSVNAATVRQKQQDDDTELRAAIEASLKEMDGEQAAHAVAHAEPLTPQPERAPLVDLAPEDPPTSVPHFDRRFSPVNEPLSMAAMRGPPSEISEDELYRVTPELTRARLATLDAQQPAVTLEAPTHPQPMEASFYSAPSSVSPPPSTATIDHERPQLIDVADADVPQGESARTPTSHPSSFGFQSDSGSETFASLAGSRAPSQAPSQVHSEISGIEVIDVEEDSDVDMFSESGIATPESWSEVGSRDGEESEADPQENSQQAVRAGL